LTAVWHVLTERVADKHAEPKMVACKLMRWSWELTEEQRGGLSSRQFIRLCQPRNKKSAESRFKMSAFSRLKSPL
jgi:hypothetical protein